MDLWPITFEARRSLLSTYENLDDEQWAVQSLCEGWTVRQVLAHLILAARPPVRSYAAAVVKARGSFDRANHSLAVAAALRSPAQLMADYRDVINHRFSLPGWPDAAPYSDILLHTLDVRIPLGIETDRPACDYEPALRLLLGPAGRGLTTKGRPKVRWTAMDHKWSHGRGPEVRGTMQDLALTAAGRAAGVERLSGDGVRLVRQALS